MCIANAMSSWGFGPFATHPPIEKRIMRIDPSWDGKFKNPTRAVEERRDKAKQRAQQKLDPIPLAGDPTGMLPGMPGGMPGAIVGAAVMADAAGGAGAPANNAAVDQIGQVSSTHVSYMHELLDRIPQAMKDAAHDPDSARAVIYTVLLDQDSAVRGKQLEFVAKHADPAVTKLTKELAEQSGDLPKEARLPLIDMAVPALREMSDEAYVLFKKQIDALIKADGRVDLFEWVLQRLLFRHLDLHFEHKPEPKAQYYNLMGEAEADPCVRQDDRRRRRGDAWRGRINACHR